MFAGKEPVSRKFQSLTAVPNQIVMFGGQSLEDNADLNDLFYLRKVKLCSAQPALSQAHLRLVVPSNFSVC